MAIEVSHHLEQRIREKLREGRYRSADELIDDALSSLDELAAERRKQAIAAALASYVGDGRDPGPPEGVTQEEWGAHRDAIAARFQADVAEALSELDRGEFVDGEGLFDSLDAELAEEERRLRGE